MFFKNTISLVNGLCRIANIELFCIFFLLLVSVSILVLTSLYPYINSTKIFVVKNILQGSRQEYRIIEYGLIILFILIGSLLLITCNDLITMFLAIELQSYGLYIVSSIYRNYEPSITAGLTYFLLGGLSSCIILLGQSFLYVNNGTTNLHCLFLISIIASYSSFLTRKASKESGDLIGLYSEKQGYRSQLSYIILSIGFLFKVSSAPFHSWSPTVYNNIPTITTVFVAVIPKLSIFIFLLNIVYWTGVDYNDKNTSLIIVIAISSFLSLLIGSVLGLCQYNIKKLYAYSTISHVAFILLGLSNLSVEAIQGFIFYVIQYSLTNLNAFLLLIIIGYVYTYYINNSQKTINKASESSNELEKPLTIPSKDTMQNETVEKETIENILEKKSNRSIQKKNLQTFISKLKNLSPVKNIDELKGYITINGTTSLSLATMFFSFIGIPPLLGFFSKQMILSSGLNNGYVFICLVAAITSVISAGYYLYVIKTIFFDKNGFKANNSIIPLNKSHYISLYKDSLYNRNYLSYVKNFLDVKKSKHLNIIPYISQAEDYKVYFSFSTKISFVCNRASKKLACLALSLKELGLLKIWVEKTIFNSRI